MQKQTSKTELIEISIIGREDTKKRLLHYQKALKKKERGEKSA